MEQPTPIARVITVDQNQVRLLQDALKRVENGEQFSGIAVLFADSKGYEYPYSGKFFELLLCATRFAHAMNMKMDARCEENV